MLIISNLKTILTIFAGNQYSSLKIELIQLSKNSKSQRIRFEEKSQLPNTINSELQFYQYPERIWHW